jgi:hypothetical protein
VFVRETHLSATAPESPRKPVRPEKVDQVKRSADDGLRDTLNGRSAFWAYCTAFSLPLPVPSNPFETPG